MCYCSVIVIFASKMQEEDLLKLWNNFLFSNIQFDFSSSSV